jgi:hypothetical protein
VAAGGRNIFFGSENFFKTLLGSWESIPFKMNSLRSSENLFSPGSLGAGSVAPFTLDARDTDRLVMDGPRRPRRDGDAMPTKMLEIVRLVLLAIPLSSSR